METLYQILGLMGAGLVIYILYQFVKGKPELFSKDNMNKSFYTMGLLGVGLIGFIALLVLMLRSS